MIVLKNMAKVTLPEEHRRTVLDMYMHNARGGGDRIKNYKYANGVAYLPLNPTKLKMVATLLGEEISDQRSMGGALQHAFEPAEGFKLRPHQVKAAPALVHEVAHNRYAVLFAGCGLGKTVVMSWAAGLLGVKILIIVDMGSLLSQWQDAFLMVWNREVQILARDSEKFGDVCITTFQLLHLNPELLRRLAQEFGCLLLDEFHTTQSDTRREVLFRLNNAYRIACTATPYKKGYSDEVLTDMVADVSVVMRDAEALKPEVHFVPTGYRFVSSNPDDWGRISSELSRDAQRNLLLVKLVVELVAEGRKILVICSTVAQCKAIASQVRKFGKCLPIVYTGSTTAEQDRKLKEDVRTGRVNTIFTVKKFDKGTDVPELDTLVSARPHNNPGFLEQLSGRIVRPVEGKPPPVIYDLQDVGPLADRFIRNRMRWYQQLQYGMGAPVTLT